MARVISLVTLLLISGALKAQENKIQERSKTLKVIAYNIWNGYEWGKDSLRRTNVIDWINSEKPDVMALQELNDYTQEKLLEDAKAWGHSYVEILKTSGYPVGITSNRPIEVKERILENMHHGALHCTTWGIDFVVVHFSPFSHIKRHEEADTILSKLSDIRRQQDKIIVLGDFNAVSPFDAQYYRGNGDMLQSMLASEEKHSHIRNLLLGQLEYGAMSKYLSFPLIDLVQLHTNAFEERISSPTQVFEKESGQGRHPNSKRIDYILASPQLADSCIYARVKNGEPTYYLSDHYPVVAEFILN